MRHRPGAIGAGLRDALILGRDTIDARAALEIVGDVLDRFLDQHPRGT